MINAIEYLFIFSFCFLLATCTSYLEKNFYSNPLPIFKLNLFVKFEVFFTILETSQLPHMICISFCALFTQLSFWELFTELSRKPPLMYMGF